ncbi:MAG: hypothetical protein ATN35_03955 [Epulopiscium sp. Nele67-Bin004]|nr:MAG: hypothetical protein ATN35_03955 [Epulopiscium sp. Nele67-Bin004]
MTRLAGITFGTLLIAIATNGILLPNQLLSGGVNGIAMFANLVFGTNISLMVICLNIPLFILAYFHLTKKFVAYSLFGMLAFTFWVEITAGIVLETNEALSVVIAGGILHGLGTGLIFKCDGSSGGVDIIAKIVNKYFSFNIATISLSINAGIIVISLIYFGIDLSVLTILTMFVSSKIVNFVLDGVNRKRTIYIVTTKERHRIVCEALMSQVNRGITIIPAIGGYTQNEKSILYMTVGVREVAKVKHVVSHADPNAFMTISETFQVIGQGKGFTLPASVD